jgi:hypothetical protein
MKTINLHIKRQNQIHKKKTKYIFLRGIFHKSKNFLSFSMRSCKMIPSLSSPYFGINRQSLTIQIDEIHIRRRTILLIIIIFRGKGKLSTDTIFTLFDIIFLMTTQFV